MVRAPPRFVALVALCILAAGTAGAQKPPPNMQGKDTSPLAAGDIERKCQQEIEKLLSDALEGAKVSFAIGTWQVELFKDQPSDYLFGMIRDITKTKCPSFSSISAGLSASKPRSRSLEYLLNSGVISITGKPMKVGLATVVKIATLPQATQSLTTAQIAALEQQVDEVGRRVELMRKSIDKLASSQPQDVMRSSFGWILALLALVATGIASALLVFMGRERSLARAVAEYIEEIQSGLHAFKETRSLTNEPFDSILSQLATLTTEVRALAPKPKEIEVHHPGRDVFRDSGQESSQARRGDVDGPPEAAVNLRSARPFKPVVSREPTPPPEPIAHCEPAPPPELIAGWQRRAPAPQTEFTVNEEPAPPPELIAGWEGREPAPQPEFTMDQGPSPHSVVGQVPAPSPRLVAGREASSLLESVAGEAPLPQPDPVAGQEPPPLPDPIAGREPSPPPDAVAGLTPSPLPNPVVGWEPSLPPDLAAGRESRQSAPPPGSSVASPEPASTNRGLSSLRARSTIHPHIASIVERVAKASGTRSDFQAVQRSLQILSVERLNERTLKVSEEDPVRSSLWAVRLEADKYLLFPGRGITTNLIPYANANGDLAEKTFGGLFKIAWDATDLTVRKPAMLRRDQHGLFQVETEGQIDFFRNA